MSKRSNSKSKQSEWENAISEMDKQIAESVNQGTEWEFHSYSQSLYIHL
jgi:hypothetical protein